MYQDISFNLEVSLQKLSTLQIAAIIWGKKNIQARIKTYSLELEEKKRALHRRDEAWDEITNKALVFAETLKLPNKLLFQLRKMVFFMGEKIFIWLTYVVKRELYKFSKFSFKLSWTPHGLIDEKKMYEDLKNYQSFPGFKDVDDSAVKLWVMACLYGDIKGRNLQALRYVVRKYIGRIDLQDVNTAMSELLSWFMEKDSWDLNDSLNSDGDLDQYHLTKAEKIFLSFVGYGFDKVAEYFYNQINDDSQIVLSKAAVKCLRLSFVSSDFKHFYHHDRGRIPELLHVLNKMSSMPKREFFQQNILKVYLFFINIWPYQDFCIPFIDYIWNDLNDTLKLEVLKVTVNAIISYSEIKLDIYNSIFQPVMVHLLQKIPEELKVEFFIPNQILFELFEISNFSTIELILKDPDLKNYRSALIDISGYLSDYLKDGGNADNIKKFMNFLGFTNDEKKILVKFSDDCYLFETFILQGRIKMADEILKWQCEVTEEKIIYRKRIIREMLNPLNMCYSLIASIGFYTMEKYLSWVYDKDTDELEKMRKIIFSPEFICESFWTKWIQNYKDVNLAIEVCSEHLKKFLKPEELMSFKEKLLEEEYFVRILLNHKACGWDLYEIIFGQLDEACEIFSISTEDIRRAKKKIKGDFKSWLDFYGNKGFGLKEFFALNALIDWVCVTEEGKNTVIKRNINCKKIALFWVDICKQGLDPTIKESWCKVKEILFKWTEEYNFRKIKSEIDKLQGRKDLTKEVISKAKDLLDQMACSK